MSNEGKDEAGGMDPMDDQALWDLLGRARGRGAGPYFSRRVLREVAQAGEKRGVSGGVGGWLSGWRRTWRGPRAAVWPGAVIVAAFWLSVVLTTPTHSPVGAPRSTRPELPVAVGAVPSMAPDVAGLTNAAGETASVALADDVAPQDVEVIADLDNLIIREENRLWTEDTARF